MTRTELKQTLRRRGHETFEPQRRTLHGFNIVTCTRCGNTFRGEYPDVVARLVHDESGEAEEWWDTDTKSTYLHCKELCIKDIIE